MHVLARWVLLPAAVSMEQMSDESSLWADVDVETNLSESPCSSVGSTQLIEDFEPEEESPRQRKRSKSASYSPPRALTTEPHTSPQPQSTHGLIQRIRDSASRLDLRQRISLMESLGRLASSATPEHFKEGQLGNLYAKYSEEDHFAIRLLYEKPPTTAASAVEKVSEQKTAPAACTQTPQTRNAKETRFNCTPKHEADSSRGFNQSVVQALRFSPEFESDLAPTRHVVQLQV